MKDYGRYNSTVKTVQDLTLQAKGDYHFTYGDIETLRYAIRDLQGILDAKHDPIVCALKYDDGGYSPAVLIKDGADWRAFVYDNQPGSFTKQGALERARDTYQNWTGDNWTQYTNAPANVDYFKREGFAFYE